MKVGIRTRLPDMVEASMMKVGDIGVIMDEDEPNWDQQIVMKVYGMVIALTDPSLTWEFPDFKVSIFPAGTRVELEVE